MGRAKKRNTCSICQVKGHTSRTCSKQQTNVVDNVDTVENDDCIVDESLDSSLPNVQENTLLVDDLHERGNSQLPNTIVESQVFTDIILDASSDEDNVVAVIPQLAALQIPGTSCMVHQSNRIQSPVFNHTMFTDSSSDDGDLDQLIPQLAAEQIPGTSRMVVPALFEHSSSEIVGVEDAIVFGSLEDEFVEVEETTFNAGSESAEGSDINVQSDRDEQSSIVSSNDVDEVVNCSYCKRQETVDYPLGLGPVPYNHKRRKFGDWRNLTIDSVVCSLCNQYLNAANSPVWANAWPATLYSSFVSNSTVRTKKQLVEFLPASVRSMWAASVHSFLPEVQHLWEICVPKFADITKQIQAHKDHNEKLSLGGLMDLLNKDPFPVVRCPLGCYMFTDDLLIEKLELVPGSEYIASFEQGFTDFGASGEMLGGRHPRWPEVVKELEWEISPSIYIDPLKGLCFVQCAKSVHCNGKNKYVHVPLNPIGKYASLNVDITAPCVATTSFARHGRSNEHTSSYSVLNVKGTAGGMSSFSVSPSRPIINNPTAVELLSWGLALSNRKDISTYLAASSVEDRFWSQGVISTFAEKTDEGLVARIKECKEKSTFVAVGDSMHYAKSSSVKAPIGNLIQGGTAQYKGVQKEVLAVVHENDGVGQKPYAIPLFQRPNEVGERSGCILRAVVSSLLHCRELHRCFLKHIWRAPSELLIKLRKLVEAVSAGKRANIAPSHELEANLVALVLAADVNLNRGASVECIVSHILSLVCEVERVEIVDGFDVNAFLLGRSGVVVFDCSHDPMSGVDLPLVDGIGSFFLKLVCQATERRNTFNDVSVSFRWSHSSKWLHSDGSNKFTTHDVPPLNEIGYFVFASEKEERNLARDEFLTMSGGQEKIKCDEHRNCSLMKEQLSSNLICCSPGCHSKMKWRCSNDFPVFQCDIGLCWKHFRESERRHGEVFVYRRARIGIVEQETSDDEQVDAVDVLADIGDPLQQNYDFYVMDIADDLQCAPLASNINEPATYLSDSTNNSSGHYLLNNCLRVMSRVSVRGSVPICLQQTLQSIYSRSPTHIVPLLYPESVLFPKIFWAETDGASLGAMPAFLFSNQSVLGINNEFASLKDHLKVRLLDGNLLTSRDPYYISFAFDSLLNQNLNHNSVSVAMRKGLEFVNRAYVVPEDRESNMKFSEVDSRQKVNELASFLKDIGHWTYFITLTCNDTDTFGVAPIRRAIEWAAPNDSTKLEFLLQNYCSIMCRAWERVVRHFMFYVEHSPERPFGHVKGIWYRFEFQSQGSPGNKPHVHGGVTLHPESLDKETDLARIVCMIQLIFGIGRGADYDTLIADGIVKSWKEYEDLYILALKLTVHDCDNSNMRCMKRTIDGEKKCRVPRHPCSYTYTETEHDLYDKETLSGLEWLDLAEKVGDREWKTHESLTGRSFHYPSNARTLETPTVPRVFAAFRSVVNVQYCDKKFHTAYLVKYCAGTDEKRDIVFRKKDDSPEVIAEARDLYNAKISGSAFSTKRLRKNLDEPLARELCLPEMLWYALDLPFVATNVKFVNVSTHSPEYRTNVKKFQTRPPAKLVNADRSIKSIVTRQDLLPWRHFSPDQLVHIDDYCNGHYMLSRTGHFSVKPPELGLIKELPMYCRWFTWDSVKDQTVAADLNAHCLLDGAGYRIRVRLFYLQDVVAFFETLCNSVDAVVREQAIALHELFADLLAAVNTGDLSSQFVCRFVNVAERVAVVIVLTPVTPYKMERFLYHLLITLGKFDTEVGLSRCRNYLEAFQQVGLVGVVPRGDDDAKDIIRRYVLEQLAFLPVGSGEFSRLLACLMDYLKRFFTGGIIVHDSMPLVTSRSINEAASSELRDLVRLRRENLIAALEGQRLPNFPGRVVLEDGDPAYNPVLVQIPGQSNASYLEQCKVLTVCLQAINNYLDIAFNFVKSVLILGAPGTGKTYMCLLSCVYALTRNLHVAVTALTSERARMLGGDHLHMLLSIPVEEGAMMGATVLAEKCLLRLASNPVKFAYLKQLDVIFVEEIGMFPAKLVAVMDLVLQRIKESLLPFGGILLICSGDPRQLSPIGDVAIWTSGLMFTVFRTFVLQHFVRSRQDQDLQRLITLIRQPSVSDVDVDRALQILKDRCVPLQFVPTWDDVPLNVLRVVGKKKAEQEAVRQYLAVKKQTPGLQWQEHVATDEVEVTQGIWRGADASVSNMIQYRVTEERKLLIHEGAVMRLTYNNATATANQPVFSQGQIVVVIELPDQTKSHADQRLKAVLVPPGCRDFDQANLPPQWPTCILARRSSTPVVIGRGNLKGRREQWPLRYFVAYTVHKIIGDTCTRLATQISMTDSIYRLWEREQLLVIISRVTSLDDITFVGGVEDTFTAMRALLKMRSHRTEHVHEVVSALDELSNDCVINNYLAEPSHGVVDVPASRCGFVFIVRSVKNFSVWRIEESVCLRDALTQLNRCSFSIDSSLRPWMLVAFICGFPIQGFQDEIDENRVEREELVLLLKIAIEHQAHVDGIDRIECSEACTLGKQVVREFNATNIDSKLVWRQCFVFGQAPVFQNVRPIPAVGNNVALGNLRIRMNRL